MFFQGHKSRIVYSTQDPDGFYVLIHYISVTNKYLVIVTKYDVSCNALVDCHADPFWGINSNDFDDCEKAANKLKEDVKKLLPKGTV